MKIEMGKKETADSLIRKGERVLLQSLNRLKTDNSEVYAQFRERNPELNDAITKYCSVYKKEKKVDDDGILEEFSLASKKLIKAFRFTDAARDYGFVSDNFMDILDSPLYLSLETIFDVSLFKEKGKMRMFKNTYALLLWSSIFVTLVAKKYQLLIKLPPLLHAG